MTWQTAAELAAELRPDASPEVGERWVKEQMAAGVIPSVKVGSKRYFTPECRAEMVRRSLTDPVHRQVDAEPEGWGQVTRGRAAS